MVDQLEPHQLEAIKALEIVFYDQQGYFTNWISVSRTLAKQFKSLPGLERVSIRFICWLQDDEVLERECEELCEAIRNSTRRKPIQVTCASNHEDNDEGKTVPDEEETTPDEEAEPGDEKLGDDDDGFPSTRRRSSDTKTATEEDNPMEK